MLVLALWVLAAGGATAAEPTAAPEPPAATAEPPEPDAAQPEPDPTQPEPDTAQPGPDVPAGDVSPSDAPRADVVEPDAADPAPPGSAASAPPGDRSDPEPAPATPAVPADAGPPSPDAPPASNAETPSPEPGGATPADDDPTVAEESWLDDSGLLLEEVDLADPLGPVEAVLDDLHDRPGIEVRGRSRTRDPLRGEMLTASLDGIDGGLLQYMLERIAEDGYQLLLEPTGNRQFLLIALRSRPGQPRGVLLVGVEDRHIEGTTRRGESTEMLGKLLVLPAGGAMPVGVTDQLATVGYLATLQATGAGE
ncbi:MAG: hypothetical protein K0V04_20090, partial [Deltaproteobacteria bacterium]|nr:hypothetical protein [Deltaproteobacteria bacterium]